MSPERVLAVVVPDWPVVAAGVPATVPACVVRANRVVAASAAARASGVVVGLRRREAQARCPEAAVLPADPARDAREFEPVALAVSELAPRLEVVEAGRCVLATRGPSRYFGGDPALAARVRAVAAEVVGDRGEVAVGVAEGPFAAGLAALEDRVVAPGATPAFLAPLPVAVLPVDARLVQVLRRLGLRTLGDLAGLAAGDVVARFGPEGERARRLAAGLDPVGLRPAPPTDPVAVAVEWDPPVERVDTAVFAARPLAEELVARLAARGEVCARLVVAAETDHGEALERSWRQDEGLAAGAVTDRVRWQLDGWLGGGAARRPTAGLTLLRLVADEVLPATGTQLDLFGGRGGADERVLRAVTHLSALLGPGAVRVPEWRGARHPLHQVVLVPAEAVDLTRPRVVGSTGAPWPGQVPGPAPSSVHPEGGRPPVEVLDAEGRPVVVDPRAAASAAPAVLVGADGRRRPVVGWAGPWPVDERWWDPSGRCRRARLHLLTEDLACQVLVERGRWWLEAEYG